MFEKNLLLEDMIAILAGCSMYIGTSFHGAITAFAYGKKVLGLDFFHYRKTKSVYHTMGEDKYYFTDGKSLRNSAIELLAEPERDDRRLLQIQLEVDNMYTAMLQTWQKTIQKERKTEFLYEYISHVHDEYCHYGYKEEEIIENKIKQRLSSQENYIKSLVEYGASMKNYADNLKNRCDELDIITANNAKDIHALHEELSAAYKKINQLQNRE